MAKLVILTEGLMGLTHELSVNPTTVGRAEGNLFQIIEPSVSGRHCEILLRGNEVVVRDLKSTNPVAAPLLASPILQQKIR